MPPRKSRKPDELRTALAAHFRGRLELDQQFDRLGLNGGGNVDRALDLIHALDAGEKVTIEGAALSAVAWSLRLIDAREADRLERGEYIVFPDGRWGRTGKTSAGDRPAEEADDTSAEEEQDAWQ